MSYSCCPRGRSGYWVVPTGWGVRSPVKWCECHEKRNFYLRQLPNNAMSCLVRYCVPCHLDGSTRGWWGVIMAQERHPSCLVRPCSHPSAKGAPVFLSGMVDVASVLHRMILCTSPPPPAPPPPVWWQAGPPPPPALVLERLRDQTKVRSGLAWPGPQRPMDWSWRRLTWSWPLANQKHAC